MDDDTTVNEDDSTSAGQSGVVPPLPQDDSPMADPDDVSTQDSQLNDTHPVTDSNIQVEEKYDEGLSGAAEASEPNMASEDNSNNPHDDGEQTP